MKVVARIPALYRLLGPARVWFWLTMGAAVGTALWSVVTFVSASALIQSVADTARAPVGFGADSSFRRAAGLLSGVAPEHRVLVGFVATAASLAGGALVALATLVINMRFLSRFLVHLQQRVFGMMLGCRMEFHDETRRSQLNQLVVVEVRACQSLAKEITSFTANALQALVHTAAMVVISLPLTLVFFAVGGAGWALSQRMNRATERWSKAGLASRNALMAVTQEALYGVKQVKLLSAEGDRRARFGRAAAESMRFLARVAILVNGQSTLMKVFGLAAVTLIVAGSLVIPGAPAVGAIVLFLFIGTGMINPVAAAAREYGIMSETLASVDSVLAFLAEEPAARERDGDLVRDRLLVERIEIDDVHLDYPRRPGILRGVSLTIARGERIGIVGASGSGKTSLVSLLPRLYDPARGRVLVDGTDVRRFRLDFLRSRIGFLSQDVFVFNTTVRENIRMGRPEAPDAEIVAAARLAHADEFIAALPDGYDTVVGDRGVKLSGGQRQRLNIAQVFLRDPEILILDEATSALDSDSEALVREAIDRLAAARTVVVVAHRLSTLRSVDRVVVVDGGAIVETGSWDELLHHGGAFARMWEMQTSAVG